MLKRKAEVFAPTDGVLLVGVDTAERMARGADFCDASLLSTLYSLAFRRMRISSRDVELADSTGFEITAKVEVRTSPSMNADCDVVLDGHLFEVTRVESRGRISWLWLSEMSSDGTCDLLSDTYTYDSVGIPSPVESEPVLVHVRHVSPGTKRRSADGADGLATVTTLRLRTIDYQGEPRLKYGGRTLSVTSTETHGRWVDVTCRERGADRG